MVLWYNRRMRMRAKGGQAMLEYVLVFAAMLLAVFALYGLVAATWRYADRTEGLVTSDCP